MNKEKSHSIIKRFWKKIHTDLHNRPKSFRGSERYWIERYKEGRTSGPGSYNRLAEFKATIINAFVQDHGIKTVIDFGCGDGNQLRLAKYSSYLGFDISPKAIALCRKLFSQDKSKAFKLMDQYAGEKAQLTISLDTIFHLVEDNVFHEYMQRLFNAAIDFVIVYASNFDDDNIDRSPQLRHRNFSKWIDQNMPQWKLIQYIPNKYPYKDDPYNESFSDFYIYQKS